MITDLLPLDYNNSYFVANISADLFINTSVALIILFFSFFSKIINITELTLFLLSICVVFIIQSLFPSSGYMADQIPYTNFVRDIRSGITPETGYVTLSASYIYSLLPLATPSSIISFSMYNKILFIVTFILLKKYSYLNTNYLITLLLFPSLILYSSLGLREMLVLLQMILWLICILNRKYILSLVLAFFFLYTKIYNFYFLGLFTILHFVYYNSVFFITKKFLTAIIILFLLTIFFLIQDLIYYEINKNIKNFYLDDFVNSGKSHIDLNFQNRDVSNLFIPQINNFFDLIIGVLKGIYKVFLGDLTFSILNKFKFIQSIENILILITLSYLVYNNFHKAKFDFIFWIFFLFSIIGMLGMVVPNFGTISRWKYSFIVLFIIAISGLINKNMIYIYKKPK